MSKCKTDHCYCWSTSNKKNMKLIKVLEILIITIFIMNLKEEIIKNGNHCAINLQISYPDLEIIYKLFLSAVPA